MLLESDDFTGSLVSARDLKIIANKYISKLDVVFVAACKSQFVGEILCAAGAKHTIFVKQ